MDPTGPFFLVTGIAIVGSLGAVIARMWFRHEERKLQLRSQGGVSQETDSLRTEFDALRTELARLRDTSTQYDISIQHTLEDMQQRLERVESRRAVTMPATREEAPAQETVIARG